MQNEWIFPTGIDETVSADHAGFVYLITNLETGRMYVGRKYFTAKRGKKMVDSKWRNYWSSSDYLKADIARLGQDKFKREILAVFKTRGEVNYAETAEQFKRDVLKAIMPDGSRAYYNGNIMSRWFAPTEASIAKVAAANKGKKRTTEQKLHQSEKMKGKTPPNKGVPMSQQQVNSILDSKRKSAEKYLYEGREITRRDIADMTGLSLATISYRINRGWTIEDIVALPAHPGNKVVK